MIALYSAADLFFNPTYEEVFGMVNIEALACGTPVLTYDTGGSPEIMRETNEKDIINIIKKENCCNVDIEETGEKIQEIVRNNKKKDCNYVKRECYKIANLFRIDIMISEYLKLYKQIVSM